MLAPTSVHRRRNRGAIARVTAIAVAMATLATSAAIASPTAARAAARPAANAPTVPQLDWAACDDGFQCAKAVVPLDYDQPQGATIKIALIRLPASDPERRIGSLFLNPGGPGGSGVDFVRFAGPFLYSNEVRARFDLVGFDPRGIARSTPLRCFDSLGDALSILTPFQFPYTRAEERMWQHSDRLLAKACTKNAGAIIDHMSTANVARDMDLLRQAVGDSKLTYAGYSYGSYLGNTYANMFPYNVRALIVDAVLDPVAWSTGRSSYEAKIKPFSTRLHSDAGAYATLQQFFELCDQGGRNCAFSGNAEQRYRKLTKQLIDHPIELPSGFVVTYDAVVGLTLGALYDPPVWPQLADILAKVERHGDRAEIDAAVRELQTRLRGYDAYPNFVEGAPGVFCADSDNPSDAKAWSVAAREADRTYGYFGRPWTWISSACAAWPGEDHDRFMGPFNHVTSNPVLVIGNRYDPATRYEGAVKVSKSLFASRLLTLDGWGHTSLFQSRCIDNYVNEYLLRKRLPPRHAVCEPDFVPFTESAARTNARPARSSLIPMRGYTSMR